MNTFIAHFRSLNSAENHSAGRFEFQSEARLGSKANLHDARIKMLEEYGNTAVSWEIYNVERKRAHDMQCNNQLELDFREEKKRKRKTKVERW